MSTSERGKQSPVIAEIKKDLRVLCANIPPSTWDKLASVHNSKDIPIGMKLESPLLPQDKSHEFRWDKETKTYVPLPVRHVMGNDVVGIYVTRDGTLLEKLVHYSSDGPDSEKWLPDEELGETSDERYQEFNKRTLFVLGSMQRLATTLSEQ